METEIGGVKAHDSAPEGESPESKRRFGLTPLGYLWLLAQPESNLSLNLMTKCNRQRNPLVVVVYRGFSATTTNEKSRRTTSVNKRQS